MEKFRVRPGYKSTELLIEFWGNHRGKGYPNIQRILEKGLNAKPKEHPIIDATYVALSTDEYISLWEYETASTNSMTTCGLISSMPQITINK